jgi:glutamine amidotransferase
MSDALRPQIAIVDYGTGNLYNVQRACAHTGLEAAITSSPDDVLGADGVILPGVGSMPDAMAELDRTGLSEALRTVARRGTPLFGICLGMQLLMAEGTEFQEHQGLGVIAGTVTRLAGRGSEGSPLKVPHIGWNSVAPPAGATTARWAGTPLASSSAGEYVYFVHSYRVVPADAGVVLAVTRYGDIEFCSALARGSVFGCQFHPERSGPHGLTMYREFAHLVRGAEALHRNSGSHT